ncbi:MAG: type II toxin-antitoxin system VapC family toxin [Dermatophilaceae bacterium]
MTDYVIDASALVMVLGAKGQAADTLRARLPGMRRHAPHLVDAEVGNVLRRHERAGLLSSVEARAAMQSARSLVDHRYPHAGPLGEHAWVLRDHLSFYDALYVALAARLDLPLLTADARLVRSPQLPCRAELV